MALCCLYDKVQADVLHLASRALLDLRSAYLAGLFLRSLRPTHLRLQALATLHPLRFLNLLCSFLPCLALPFAWTTLLWPSPLHLNHCHFSLRLSLDGNFSSSPFWSSRTSQGLGALHLSTQNFPLCIVPNLPSRSKAC